MEAKNNAGNNIAVGRYGCLSLIFFLIFAAIVFEAFKIRYVEGDVWREIGKKNMTRSDKDIYPNRGSIYAIDGRLLATSVPGFDLYMDFMADGIVGDSLKNNVDGLSRELANKFPQMNRSAAQYKRFFLDHWGRSRVEKQAKEAGNNNVRITTRYVKIFPKQLNYLELKELQAMPFFKQGRSRTGLVVEEKTNRTYPFGKLAGRTIGTRSTNVNEGGNSGIEMKFNKDIAGITGISRSQKIHGRWIDVVLQEPIAGYDVLTSLDVDYQDVAEKALYNKLAETQAESGCAIVMETKTGEIKAIINLDRTSGGGYAEGMPNAFSYMMEPGSTFKAITVLVALEDGVIEADDQFEIGNGLFNYSGRTVRDHDWNKGRDKGYMSIKEGMANSSNVMMSKIVLKGYESDPAKFVQHIHNLGITKPLEWDVPLRGVEGSANIRFPNDANRYWSKTTLPWMSFGYETQIPPIRMLMFYNAIANNGKMVKPYIVKEIQEGGSTVEQFDVEVVNPKIASKKTLEQITEMLRFVVTDGTAKPVNSSIVTIAGKTGTAQIASGGRYQNRHYVSFCGFFPVEEPKYTCFVGILAPKGIPSGGLMPGAVFKAIAEGITVREMVAKPIVAPIDTINAKLPMVKSGQTKQAKIVLDKLNIPYTSEKVDWIKTKTTDKEVELSSLTLIDNLIPNVVGMGARDAIFLLESKGLVVRIEGSGRVVSQSIAVGVRYQRGSQILLTLK